jgi:hypothetical protein
VEKGNMSKKKEKKKKKRREREKNKQKERKKSEMNQCAYWCQFPNIRLM